LGPLDFAKRRLEAFIEQVERLKINDFPYPHARQALDRVGTKFSATLTALNSLRPENDPDTVRQACSESIGQINTYLPLLGFLIRSTDVRNSFEVYSPLLRLARSFLGGQAKLVLSSEWSLSPYTFSYGIFPGLQDFVMIGLPAQESSNALLIPLAGHELGHSVWRHAQLLNVMAGPIMHHIQGQLNLRWAEWASIHPEPSASPSNPDLFTIQAVGKAHAWSVRQAEECFCDLFGLRLFGAGYLNAFAYLLAPGGLGRPYQYPDMRRRVDDLLQVASDLRIEAPAEYSFWFVEDAPVPRPDRENAFLLSLADAGAIQAKPQLLREIEQLVSTAKISSGSKDEVDRILKCFKLVVPAAATTCLADIINAAWAANVDPTFWDGNPAVQRAKGLVLTELTLKSIEVQEIESRTAGIP
jgi:hypothetical protein